MRAAATEPGVRRLGVGMSGDSIDRWRAALVGEWEPALTGPSLLFLRRARPPRARLILRADRTADWPCFRPPGAPPLPPAPFPTTWRLSDDRVLTIVRPVPPMPEYGAPDWARSEEDYRVLEAGGRTLGLTKGDVFMVFRRVPDEEHNRRLDRRPTAGEAGDGPPNPWSRP
jgi:hypothetical protein